MAPGFSAWWTRSLAASVLLLLVAGCNRTPPPDTTTDAAQQSNDSTTKSAEHVERASSNGYGSKIAWRNLAQAKTTSMASGKPMMVFVHASWCGRCKELRPIFDDPELIEVSNSLVMVNLDHDKDEAARTTFAPDGNYVPRIMFFDSSGARISDIVNPRSPEFPLYYSYGSKRELLAAMQRATEDSPTPP